MTLKISPDLKLPLDAVTQTFGILAIKGSGKSYTASVMAEEMLKCGQQIIVLDPTGAWWGLQSSADGKKEGFPIVVFGGDKGNVPLDENSGEVIAHALVEQRISAILDFSHMRKGQTNRFAAVFLETLYRINREAIHVFVDEADVFAPQKPFAEQARTLGAMEDIVRRGRKRGIGCTMITQRPAVINKDVLTQCEILIALRVNHPKDINAIQEWIKVNATVEDAKEMINSLPSMPTGQAWIWSPSWLSIFKPILIRRRETFDSGATPKPGQQMIAPKKLAQIDIKSLGEKINESVEKKKAEDPAILKRKISDLENKLQQKAIIIDNSAEIKQLKSVIIKKDLLIKRYVDFVHKIHSDVNTFDGAINSVITFDPVQSVPKITVDQKSSIKTGATTDYHVNTDDEYQLGKCERAILSVLA